eukprot:TRINITY_DN111960_c0_g1_i1.p1 TRINITY_DN111960_c0_g1~~TRINITY_DN111960_c0_g1_i1.p1  ORF type:complete len:460 (-),score=98.63 TRINITY_DN111960_c0_g1_i1:96-1475(-)
MGYDRMLGQTVESAAQNNHKVNATSPNAEASSTAKKCSHNSKSKRHGLSFPSRRDRHGAPPLPKRYQVQKLIGSGSYGAVYEAFDSESDELVAIKRVEDLFDDLTEGKRILRELSIMARLRHPNVVNILDVVVPEKRFNELCLIMEICDSDMKHLLCLDVALSPMHTTTLLYNLLVGLKHIHSAGIVHRDLKPANVLVNQDCSVKICDFGLSRTVDDCRERLPDGQRNGQRGGCLTAHVVTRWYRAPELILLQQDYTEAIDVWSAGCIYGELLKTHEGSNFTDRGPLFPGSSCFPLSPHTNIKGGMNKKADGRAAKYNALMDSGDRSDQLSVIFDLLGTPTEETIALFGKIGSQEQRYLQCFARKEGDGLRSRFPLASEDEQDMIASMLRFAAKARITVEEALEHRLFQQVREKTQEVVAEGRIHLDFEQADDLDEDSLRSHFQKELDRLQRSATKDNA